MQKRGPSDHLLVPKNEIKIKKISLPFVFASKMKKKIGLLFHLYP